MMAAVTLLMDYHGSGYQPGQRKKIDLWIGVP